MNYLDRRTFEEAIRQMLIRLDRQEQMLAAMREWKPDSAEYAMREKELMDNQDVCMLLSISKRTLQRYRSDGLLPYRVNRHKVYYSKPDVERFMSTYMKEVIRDRERETIRTRERNSKKTNRNKY